MSTAFNTIVAKLAVAFVAVAMLFSLVAPAANAQTTEELQQMINDLLAQVSTLQGQLGGDTTGGSMSGGPAGVCPFTWTRDLSVGDTGMDVMKLQQLLNSDPETRVAASGVGSAGMETEYFGSLTADAVSKMQVKYRSDILTPAGLVNPTGYFGPSSRAKANALCTQVVVEEEVEEELEEEEGTEEEEEMEEDELSGGEADVTDFDATDEEDEVAEGDENVPVMSLEFDVEEGDVTMERLDVSFDGTAIGTEGEDEPWNAFDEISIWVDGDMIASEDASDEDDWDETSTDVYEFRITGLDTIFREDTTNEILVAVSAANGVDVDGTAGEDDWTIDVPQNGLRFRDSLGLDIYVPTASVGSDNATFEIIEAGENDALELQSSDEDPDGTTLEVDEDDNKEHMIFAFDLSAEDSDNTITLEDLYVSVLVAGTDCTTVDACVSDFRLVVDGTSFDAESYDGDELFVTNMNFDIDGDVTIDADETVTAMLYADFEDVASAFASDNTIQASTTASTIDADGADSVTATGGTKTGDQHSLLLEGLIFGDEPTDGTDSEDSTQVVSASQTSDNYGTMFLEFEIEVFGDDAWVPINDINRDTAASTTRGLTYEVLLDGSGTASTGIDVAIEYDIIGAEEDNGYYELEDGQTYTVEVNIESLDPEATGLYAFRVHSLGFNTTEDTAPNAAAEPDDITDYVSDSVSIQE